MIPSLPQFTVPKNLFIDPNNKTEQPSIIVVEMLSLSAVVHRDAHQCLKVGGKPPHPQQGTEATQALHNSLLPFTIAVISLSHRYSSTRTPSIARRANNSSSRRTSPPEQPRLAGSECRQSSLLQGQIEHDARLQFYRQNVSAAL